MSEDGLTRAAPETRGVSPNAVAGLLDEAARRGIELNSFMLWRGGAVIAEGWWWPYRAALPHMMHSATNSFLSAAIGLAIAEGRFALDTRVAALFADRLPRDATDRLMAMTVEDLLTQTSGHAQGASGSVWRGIATSWIDEFFKIPVAHMPGTVFKYSSASSFMLSAILSRTTGQTAHDYLTPRLLRPLGICGLTWDVGPETINPGGNGISCRTADLLKLAVLHLQGGVWNGERILPEAWVQAATRSQRGHAHGYHWWIGPQDSYYAYGVFGQFAFVFPRHDAVLAITAAVPPGEADLRALVWEHVPGLLTGKTTQPAATGAALRLLPALEPTDSPLAGAINGRVFVADANEDGVSSLRFAFSAERCVLHLHDRRGAHRIEAGLTDWIESHTTVSGAALHHGYEPASLRVVAGGRWLDAACLEMTCQFVETSFRDRFTFRFVDDAVTMERSVNVNSGATARPAIIARMQPA